MMSTKILRRRSTWMALTALAAIGAVAIVVYVVRPSDKNYEIETAVVGLTALWCVAKPRLG